MKKYLIFCILLGLVLIAGSAMAAGQTTTLLVYMCGTDLQQDRATDGKRGRVMKLIDARYNRWN